MQLDVVNLTIQERESILVTILVCDWNVRAQTVLEATQGCQNLHILCHNNKVVSLKENLQIVLDEGSLNIATLFSRAQHLLPSTYGFQVHEQYPGLHEAGSTLSYQHALRSGDEFIIWSLLCNKKRSITIKDLWGQEVKNKSFINTGFLMSSVPRIQGVKGRSWAPQRPDVALLKSPATTDSGKCFPAYNGVRSETGVVRRNSLYAIWLYYQFPGMKQKRGIVNCITGVFNHWDTPALRRRA